MRHLQELISPEQRSALADLAAFLEFSLESGRYSYDDVLATVEHAAEGLRKHDPTFLARTCGGRDFLARFRAGATRSDRAASRNNE